MGVLMFGRAAARLEDQWHTLELSRMVLLDECPRNSESRVLALAARWIRQHLPDIFRLIAYADPGQGHKGTIYRAVGWRLVGMTRGGSWTRTGRPRRGASPGPKLKFELLLQNRNRSDRKNCQQIENSDRCARAHFFQARFFSFSAPGPGDVRAFCFL
ncbi:MAG: hypothetical protein HPY58_13205 [Firmicutes bacterium]|nr:hypothetical protein [Bacillota bacterium]